MNNTHVRLADWHKDMKDIMYIRQAVFIKEQNVSPEQEWDEFDTTSIHFLAIDGDYAMGTARLILEDNAQAHIGRVAVLKDWRGLHIGEMILNKAIEEAKQREVKTLILAAQKHAIGFYSRFGFKTEGEEFIEAGILHVNMKRAL